MAKLVDVKPVTVSRWLGEKSEITAANMRNLSRVLTLDKQALAAILDEGDADE